MYEIAICDDDQAEMDKVERMLHSYRRQSAAGGFLIRQFAGAEKLLFAVQQEAYQPDLIFMDRCGQETAKNGKYQPDCISDPLQGARVGCV